MISLVLEASTYTGSAALLDGESVACERSVTMRGREHETLMPAVAALFAEHGTAPTRVDRVLCGAGPGSFTSLRIAASIAKGIAMAAGASLFPISSLALVVASREPLTPGRYLAAIDAMRGEHYVQEFHVDRAGVVRQVGEPGIVASSAVEQMARGIGAEAIGPMRGGHAEVIPHARGAARITNLLAVSSPADVAAWEPAYGRFAEAQIKWEAAHGRPLHAG